MPSPFKGGKDKGTGGCVCVCVYKGFVMILYKPSTINEIKFLMVHDIGSMFSTTC